MYVTNTVPYIVKLQFQVLKTIFYVAFNSPILDFKHQPFSNLDLTLTCLRLYVLSQS